MQLNLGGGSRVVPGTHSNDTRFPLAIVSLVFLVYFQGKNTSEGGGGKKSRKGIKLTYKDIAAAFLQANGICHQQLGNLPIGQPRIILRLESHQSSRSCHHCP